MRLGNDLGPYRKIGSLGLGVLWRLCACEPGQLRLKRLLVLALGSR